MATSAYRIFYGKYPDLTANEIPNTQIKSLDGLQFRIEPGKPAEPKVDSVSFTLENLNYDGTERYDRAWFDNESRSEAEGGTFPGQLFFSIELETGATFLGVLKEKSYGKWRETITITLKSLLELVSDNNLSMLGSISIEEGNVVFIRNCGDSHNSFPCARDLNGDDFKQQKLEFRTDFRVYEQGDDPGFDNTDLLYYLFGQSSFPEPVEGDSSQDIERDSGFINMYVKINEVTILTTVRIIMVKSWRTVPTKPLQNFIQIDIYHADVDIVSTDGRNILPRGRFFADQKGTYIEENTTYQVTLIGPDMGYSPDIILKQADMPATQFMFGCPVQIEAGKLQILDASTSRDVIRLFNVTLDALTSHLFDAYFYNSAAPIDLSNQNSIATYAFWGDLGMFGWVGGNTGDVLVNMSMLAGCFIFYNEQGKIVFQDRLLHSGLPDTLPAGAFEVKLEDIRPLGSQEDSNGFDSFTINYNDRIEINNVESEAEKKVAIDASGLRDKPALRNTDLKVEAYRTQNLGVPTTQNGLPLFRRSPDDPDFNITGEDLDNFILTAPQQAQNFAETWTYPVELWKIEWDMPNYPDAGIGKYFWVQWPAEKRVYFIRDITHDADKLTHRMEVQKVGVWNG